MCRPKIIVIIALIYILLLALLLLSEGPAPGILLLLVTLVLILSLVMVLTTGRSIEIRIQGGEQVKPGDRCSYRVIFENKSLLPILDATLSLRISNLLTGRKSDILRRISVPGRSTGTIDVEWDAEHVGKTECLCSDIRISDPMGLFSRRSPQEAGGACYVIPEISDREINESDISAYDMESYKYSEYTSGGDPSETFEIREYMPGDSIKGIHWKLTAKMNDIMLREASLPIENTVMILLNKCCSLPPEDVDRTMGVFASLSSKLVDMEVTHSVGWYRTDRREMEIRQVTDEQDFWTALLASLEGPFQDTEGTAPGFFSLADVEKTWASYIYVSGSDEDVDLLRRHGEVTIVRPSDYK